ncbi:STAS domain-containing protein [Pseudonocardia endophytica]|uniref:Anti-anti-sigma factor n=1 Tax=Pseudonocardia endophytica TaxID=401976 RepID=A0A4R1HJM1_PSEEN|nr:STAS domain-containing protein [Pseudonocardia endophytica]TCK21093.1 anti-anti-sigma factor [Pseudonocardia endophytica]
MTTPPHDAMRTPPDRPFTVVAPAPDAARAAGKPDDDDAPPGSGVRVRITRTRPDVTVVTLAGDLDIATADVAATALADTVIAGAGGWIVLDLNHVSVLSAHGLAVILASRDHARHHGGTVVLVVDQAAPASRTLRFLHPANAPATYPTLTTALTALTGPEPE